MDEHRARWAVDQLRALGVPAHLQLARAGQTQYGIRINLPDGREAVWDTDGTAGLEAQVLRNGMLVGFVPVIDGSEHFTPEQAVDAIAHTDYDRPIARRVSSPPLRGPALPPEGGFFRRLMGGFR
ncbi:hypothetical protein [Catenuloplanes japonicus]|uniref:hypothetical protein n=1 Tax=Catenuloplanes japonicus TaxID=33876 RepID=UPI00052462BD|nr:hypothetical protein [Catenuloplanes japonicus]